MEKKDYQMIKQFIIDPTVTLVEILWDEEEDFHPFITLFVVFIFNVFRGFFLKRSQLLGFDLLSILLPFMKLIGEIFGMSIVRSYW